MKLFASVLLLAALSLGVVIEGTTFQTVEVSLSGGRTFRGEILAVRDSFVVFGTRPGLDPPEMVTGTDAVLVVPFSRVRTISTEGASNAAATGTLIGATLGCLGGLAVGSSSDVDKKPDDLFGCGAQIEHGADQATGMLVGTGIGMLIGCAIGTSTGEKGQTLVSPDQRDFSFLRSYARYPHDEPESLRMVGR